MSDNSRNSVSAVGGGAANRAAAVAGATPNRAPDGAPRVASARGLRLDGVSKRYPGVQALDMVSLGVEPGRVRALLGENGAGKSTILKILSGAVTPDSGTVSVGGAAVRMSAPADAARAGIATIYQELSLVPWLSVANNLFLGRERTAGFPFISPRRLRSLAADALRRLGSGVDPAASVATLGMADRQMVEICRALSVESKYVLMDEPTASMSVAEIERLFEAVDAMRASGVGILYVSHRLEEIQRIADDVTVMRDGRVVYEGPNGERSLSELISLMVGRTIDERYPKRSSAPGEVALEVDDPGLGGVRFEARAGEVVGVAGLVGAGRTEWARRVFGADRLSGLSVKVRGRAVAIRSPRRARDLGLGLVPESRKEDGLVLGRSVRDNITLAVLDRISIAGTFIRASLQSRTSAGFVESLRIKCPEDRVAVSTLSGGNQQKVVVAKWLACDGQVVIFDEPTRGIDVGAKHEMYELINAMCSKGKAIVMISSDLPELLSMSDRIYVMRGGRFVAELPRRAATQEAVLRLASGIEEEAST